MKSLADVPERRAAFREEKVLAMLDAPLVSTGLLVWRRPSHLEKITTEPSPESLIVDGDRLTITIGRDAPRTVDLRAQPEIRALVGTLRGVLAGDLSALRRGFDVRAVDGRIWRITLRPIDPALARLLRAVTIDGAGNTPTVIDMVQADGDEQRLTIEPLP